MKKETISKVDLNFTNSGGGHTASVTTVLSAKNLDGSHGLGTVIGKLGEPNSFSNAAIGRMLGRFICTEITTNVNPVNTTLSRKYVDKTSLMLKSIIVLVRGLNCSPEGGLDFGLATEENGTVGGVVPYFSEVSNSPLKAFPSKGPERPDNGSVIVAGRIYNYEAGALFDGTKLALCYNDHDLIKELSLNLDFIYDSYERSPDLAQFELKYGYTLNDVKEICGLADIVVENLPDADDVLFETSGTLESVLGNVASTLGCFWYVDPNNGKVVFVNTVAASGIPVSNYTETTDTNVISASFSQSLVTSQVVNAYVGSAEKQEQDSSGPDENRPRPIFFKRIDFTKAWEEEGGEGKAWPLDAKDIKVFFGLFNQSEDVDIFDKFTYILVHLNQKDDKGVSLIEQEFGRSLNIQKVYGYIPVNKETHWFGPDAKDLESNDFRRANKIDLGKPVFAMTGRQFDIDSPSSLGKGEDGLGESLPRTGKDGFYYKLLTFRGEKPDSLGNLKKAIMPKPSESKLYPFLKAFFEIAGGVYISNGYSKYKALRMQFSNTNNITIAGPFKGDENIEDIDELSSLDDALTQIEIPRGERTIKNLKEWTRGASVAQSGGSLKSYYFLGIRTIPKLERKNIPLREGDPNPSNLIDFSQLSDGVEFLQHPIRKYALYIGGPDKDGEKFYKGIFDLMKQSKTNYDLAVGEGLPKGKRNKLRLEYIRSKTRVNQLSEDGEVDEDDETAQKSDKGQQESDLADRYDLRVYNVNAPPYNMLNNLSLASSSGSTVEMKILQGLRSSFINPTDTPSSSSRTMYGLHSPFTMDKVLGVLRYSPLINSVSIMVGTGGIQTTINESSIKIIPPSQDILMSRGMEALTPQPTQGRLSAAQRNALGL